MQNLIALFTNSKRTQITLWLATSVFICLAMVQFRLAISGVYYFKFLIWNMFLAVIPFGVSSVTRVLFQTKPSKAILASGFFFWLLFFPNAPYILTDLFHLRRYQGVPFWYDLLLILSFGCTGLMLGYASLVDFHTMISKAYNKFIGNIFVISSLLLSGFGIYLGRFERWNSWDIVSNPKGLAKDILKPVLYPTQNLRVWYITIAFALFLIIGYYTIRQLNKLAIITEQNKD